MATWKLDPDTTHLNHGSFGATPVEVLDRQAELRTEMEANPVAFMLRRYQPLLETSREQLAQFVGADAAGLVFVPNATYGVNSVLRSLESTLAPGSEILITTHTYNACANAAHETARRISGQVAVADVPFPVGSPEEVTDAILSAVTDATSLVLLDHVTSATGLIMPIAQIAEQLPPNITVLVDGAHAPGMIPVDIAALGVNFYTANCHKWICSPKGAAFLWVRDDHRPHTRAAVISHGYNDGWPNSSTSFHAQFDWTGTDDPTARLCVASALDTMATHLDGGWAELRSINHALVLEGRSIVAQALGCELPTPDTMIGSIAALPVPPSPNAADDIFDALTDRLHHDWRIEVPVFAWPSSAGRMLRVSAQQYNSIEDYERLATALEQLDVRF